MTLGIEQQTRCGQGLGVSPALPARSPFAHYTVSRSVSTSRNPGSLSSSLEFWKGPALPPSRHFVGTGSRRSSFGDLGLSTSSFLDWGKDVLARSGLSQSELESTLLSSYEKEIVKYDPYFEKKGRQVARLAMAEILPSFMAPIPGPEPTSPSTSTMVQRLYKPVLDPAMRGALDETKLLVRPLITKALLGAAGVALLLMLLGRISKSCR
jgi:hypothetical protein